MPIKSNIVPAIFSGAVAAAIFSCNNNRAPFKETAVSDTAAFIKRGEYIVAIGGSDDYN